jgi:uncharacterized protein (DUF433 family)
LRLWACGDGAQRRWIEARIVAERYRAGESIVVLAKDYGVDLEQVEDAIRCETREAA